MNAEQSFQEAVRRANQPGITELDVSDLRTLDRLPPLPESLETLNCSSTQITQLPPLPESLERLYCYSTRITQLPPLPNTLKVLYCDNTRITQLPPLPNTLQALECSSTRITQLPPLPDTLESLNCDNTRIRQIPPLPASIQVIRFNNTPLIEPFRSYYNLFVTRKDELDESIDTDANNFEETYVEELTNLITELRNNVINGYRQQLRNTLRTRQVFTMGNPTVPNVLSQEGGPINIVGSYLSGRNGSLTRQITNLRRTIGLEGGKRKTRRYGKKRSTRKHRKTAHKTR